MDTTDSHRAAARLAGLAYPWTVFGVASSAWCSASTLAFIIAPGFGKAVNLYALDTPMTLFEMGTSVWLLIDGLRPSRP